MKIQKKNIVAITLAIFGIVALSLGFASIFGDVSVGGKVKDAYESAGNMSAGILKSHIMFAFAGGITAVILGFLTIASSVQVFMKQPNKKIIISSAVLAIIALVIGIAAIACQGQLNNLVWVTEHMITEAKA